MGVVDEVAGAGSGVQARLDLHDRPRRTGQMVFEKGPHPLGEFWLGQAITGVGVHLRAAGVQADLDPDDQDVQYITPKLRSGLVDEMSFKFRINSGGVNVVWCRTEGVRAASVTGWIVLRCWWLSL